MNDFTGRRILVVDDERTNRRLIEAILAPEGGTIVQAPDGATALSILLSQEIDLVLLDVMMPGIDGIEVCQRIRDRSRGDYIPVILVTALADVDSRARGKAAGADDFMTKPVHCDELLARCRNLLRTRAYHQLVQRQHRDAEREARRWRLVSEVANAVAVCVDYPRLLLQISAALAPQLPIECVAVLDVEDEHLLLRGAWTDPKCRRQAVPNARFAWQPTAWLERAQGAPAVPVATTDALGRALIATLGFDHAIAVPVFGAGALHGILIAARTRAFSNDDLAVFAQLAPHVGNAVNNVRLHLRAEHLLRAREELAQLIVHDLRNPLSAAQVNVELALEPDVPVADRQDMLQDAQAALHRMVGLVSDLLDASAAEEGRLSLAREPVGLAPLARSVIDQLAPVHAASYRVELTAPDDAALDADVDPKLLCRVLENIIANAARFVPPRGRIGLDLRRDDRDIVITIANDGPSIAPELRAKLFQKYASESTAGRTRGLGLYFCRMVVEAHGGTIRETGPATGVCFEMRLPATRAAAASAA